MSFIPIFRCTFQDQEREYSSINNTRSNQEKEYVGVDTLLNQVHRNSLKSGFEFNLMVVGKKRKMEKKKKSGVTAAIFCYNVWFCLSEFYSSLMFLFR